MVVALLGTEETSQTSLHCLGRGINWSKFKVMDLVKTLRNPKKYTRIGAWTPVDLFLEEPPCAGECCVGAYSLLDFHLEGAYY